MRLLECNDNADFSLTKDLAADNIPKYAIFSHTWRADGEEVMFENLLKGNWQRERLAMRRFDSVENKLHVTVYNTFG